MKNTFLCIFLSLVYWTSPSACCADGLPEYYLHIDRDNLDFLNNNPYTDTYVPGEITAYSETADCEIRFRGATSRGYPKKNWKIKIRDDFEHLEYKTLNLNADYVDASHMRNYLACRLFQYMGMPASNVDFVKLYVNGEYYGVFSQVEQVDEEFFSRRDNETGDLFKAVNHGANMSPLMHNDWYPLSWEIKNGGYRDMKNLFSAIRYSSDEDFDRIVAERIDVENILTYFAVTFAISSFDNFTKNYYFHRHPVRDTFEMIPWDNDAAFGNDWEGVYNETNANETDWTFLNYQALFQRMMQNETWHNEFNSLVQTIIHEGFAYLDIQIDSTYEEIREGVYNDSMKKHDNGVFDTSIELLHAFLDDRRSTLDERDFFRRPVLSGLECTNPFPSDDNPDVTFRVYSPQENDVYIWYSDDLDFGIFGDTFTKQTLPLYDDGQHADMAAGDGIYGNTLTVPRGFSGLIPYCVAAGPHYLPWNDLFYANYYRTATPVLNCLNREPSSPDDVSVSGIYNIQGHNHVRLTNNASRAIDISYCCLEGNTYHRKFIIPESTRIPANGTIIVSTNKDLSEQLFPDVSTVGGLFFEINEGDSVRFLAPDMTEITSYTCNEFAYYDLHIPSVVINEINYNAPDDRETGDWVELYNAGDDTVDLAGWTFKDSEHDHTFELPAVALAPDEYLVLSNDLSAFARFFPNIDTVVGPFDFGLSGSGELISLHDSRSVLVDSVRYDDDPPWPEEADGEGATLALVHPARDNARPENWTASRLMGSPGTENNSTAVEETGPAPFDLGRNYPNPFNGATTIPFTVSHEGLVTLSVYTLHGQCIETLVDTFLQPGSYSVVFDDVTAASGIYFYRLTTAGTSETHAMLLVK